MSKLVMLMVYYYMLMVYYYITFDMQDEITLHYFGKLLSFCYHLILSTSF